ncbi:MAG: metallophosphoesterase [Planctomycetes bacterium]|nr:metallophosphoesterase [Planctomycetota bacterium]
MTRRASTAAAKPARRIFVGDVQGCRAPLEHLLAAVAFRRDVDRLLPTGDLVAKGPDSLGVLRLMIELGAEPVIGNHDLHWLANGWIPDERMAAWLRSQPVVRLFDDVILVHGGLHPHWTDADLPDLRGPAVDYAVTVRYCDAEGNRPPTDWPPPGPPFAPWDTFYRGRRRVVFGHWARRGLEVTPRVVALDSGCVYGGPLSAWIAEEDRIVQVPGNTP